MKNENKKTAIVIGATGLVGSQLVDLLLNDENYDKVNIFVRRATGITDSKLNEYVVDFDHPDVWRDKVKGDVLFSAMGTTLKNAGSKERQYEIDYHYQYNTAVTAVANGVADYILISSTNANANSMLFYCRMKGELEDSVTKLPFKTITIIQPGLLYGDRKEKRGFEDLAIKCYKWFSKMGLMKNSSTIHSKQVAQAMLSAHDLASGIVIYKGLELFSLAKKYKDQVF